jgi:isopentenyl-diphosphate delta-isomerase
MINYYQQKQFVAEINKSDHIIGKIEKWQAHRKGILHRGFTVVLFYEDQIIMQCRKHPVFDRHLDTSFSSHQVYINNILQTDLEAIGQSLKREWNIGKIDLIDEPKLLGKIYYKAKDTNSNLIEHEIDYIYTVELNNAPCPNLDYAYGCSLVDKMQLINGHYLNKNNLAPWAEKIIQKLKHG